MILLTVDKLFGVGLGKLIHASKEGPATSLKPFLIYYGEINIHTNRNWKQVLGAHLILVTMWWHENQKGCDASSEQETICWPFQAFRNLIGVASQSWRKRSHSNSSSCVEFKRYSCQAAWKVLAVQCSLLNIPSAIDSCVKNFAIVNCLQGKSQRWAQSIFMKTKEAHGVTATNSKWSHKFRCLSKFRLITAPYPSAFARSLHPHHSAERMPQRILLSQCCKR